MRFVVLIDYTDMEARNRALEAHRAYLAAGRDAGTVVESGAFADGKGGMYVLEMPDEAAARAFVATDPYKTGANLAMTIRQWQSVRGEKH
jgi:uncharacterized protein YciI